MKAALVLFVAATVAGQAAHYPQNGGFDLTPNSPKMNFSKRWNNFDFELLKIMGENVGGNFMISPASIKSVLVMLLEGARGNCAQQLRDTLRLPPDQDEIRFVLGDYLKRLQTNTPGVVIEAANKVFVSDRYSTNPNYEGVLRKHYMTETQAVSFSYPRQAAYTINNWVKEHTHNQITDLIDEGSIDSETVIVLVNALYFKGNWDSSFDPKLTSEKCFYRNNNCIKVPMMELQTELNYATIEEIDSQVVELPYAENKYSMLIILPMQRNGITSVHKDFSQSTLSLILGKMEKIDVDLLLPKFTIDYYTDVTNTLKKMGIHDLFSKNADLSNMINSDGHPQVNSVVHKTRIQVDEYGSVAAAATGAMVIPLMGSTTARMTVEHPFMFLIRETHTGAILFAGKVEQPDASLNPLGAEYGSVFNNGNTKPYAPPQGAPQRTLFDTSVTNNARTTSSQSGLNTQNYKPPLSSIQRYNQRNRQPNIQSNTYYGKDESNFINTAQPVQNPNPTTNVVIGKRPFSPQQNPSPNYPLYSNNQPIPSTPYTYYNTPTNQNQNNLQLYNNNQASPSYNTPSSSPRYQQPLQRDDRYIFAT